MSLDRSACSGKFSSGVSCPAAGRCDRYRRGQNSSNPRQVWGSFEEDATGQQCGEFNEVFAEKFMELVAQKARIAAVFRRLAQR